MNICKELFWALNLNQYWIWIYILNIWNIISNNPEIFYNKLKECGKVTIKNNAIEIGYTYFIKK